MIDSKVFNELMNRGIITQVGLNPENYKDIADLQRHGLATNIGSVEVYEDVISELVNIEEVIAKFLADIKAEAVVTALGFAALTPAEIYAACGLTYTAPDA